MDIWWSFMLLSNTLHDQILTSNNSKAITIPPRFLSSKQKQRLWSSKCERLMIASCCLFEERLKADTEMGNNMGRKEKNCSLVLLFSSSNPFIHLSASTKHHTGTSTHSLTYRTETHLAVLNEWLVRREQLNRLPFSKVWSNCSFADTEKQEYKWLREPQSNNDAPLMPERKEWME